MIAIFYLVLQILKLYSYVVVANVIVSWLISFNVLNTQNRFVYALLELSYRLTEPFLRRIIGEISKEPKFGRNRLILYKIGSVKR